MTGSFLRLFTLAASATTSATDMVLFAFDETVLFYTPARFVPVGRIWITSESNLCVIPREHLLSKPAHTCTWHRFLSLAGKLFACPSEASHDDRQSLLQPFRSHPFWA